jgi:hypothetical protein
LVQAYPRFLPSAPQAKSRPAPADEVAKNYELTTPPAGARNFFSEGTFKAIFHPQNIMSDTFPHATLTPLAQEAPSQQALALLIRELTANAMSVPSPRGDGISGHYALVTSAATYLQDTGTDFDPPVTPGPEPVHLATDTPAQITETNRKYLADFKEFRLFCSTEALLKRQLLEAVPTRFTARLSDKKFGYAKVTTFALLDHLTTNYGAITADDLDKNLANMNKAWTNNQPIEDLFLQLHLAQEFAADTDPISDAAAIRSALANITRTGLYADALRDWRKLPEANQTLERFETDFSHAHKDLKLMATTSTAGYHHAAAATGRPATVPVPVRPTPAAATAPPSFYCWTHGLHRNPEHTSATCQKPAPGHRKDAVFGNMLGGCNLMARNKGEPAVWKRPERTPPPS